MVVIPKDDLTSVYTKNEKISVKMYDKLCKVDEKTGEIEGERW